MDLKLHSPWGGEPLVYQWPQNPADGRHMSDLLETMRWVTEDYPEMKIPMERILQDVDSKNYNSIKVACNKFNKAMDELRQLWNGTARLANLRKLPSNGLLRHIMQHCYNKSVTDPEKLNQYEPFSPEVYGETSFELVDYVVRLISDKLGENDTFLDLGSGVGQVVLQVAASRNIKLVYGIEKADIPARYAKSMEEEFHRLLAWFGKTSSPYMLEKGDFLCNEGIQEKINNASVVFVNNYAFGPQVDHELKGLFVNMKEGAIIVSSKSFCPLNFRLSDRNLNDIASMLQVTELSPLTGAVSWTNRPVTYYLHTVDRTNLERYFESLKDPKNKVDEHNSKHRPSSKTDSDDTSRKENVKVQKAFLSRRKHDAMRKDHDATKQKLVSSKKCNMDRPHKRKPLAKSLDASLSLLHQHTMMNIAAASSSAAASSATSSPVPCSGYSSSSSSSSASSGDPSSFVFCGTDGSVSAAAATSSDPTADGSNSGSSSSTASASQAVSALDQLLDIYKQQMLAHVASMQHPSYRVAVEQALERERARNFELRKQQSHLHAILAQMLVDGEALLRKRISELGLVAGTRAELLAEVKETVAKHRRLQESTDALRIQCSQLAQEYHCLVQMHDAKAMSFLHQQSQTALSPHGCSSPIQRNHPPAAGNDADLHLRNAAVETASAAYLPNVGATQPSEITCIAAGTLPVPSPASLIAASSPARADVASTRDTNASLLSTSATPLHNHDVVPRQILARSPSSEADRGRVSPVVEASCMTLSSASVQATSLKLESQGVTNAVAASDARKSAAPSDELSCGSPVSATVMHGSNFDNQSCSESPRIGNEAVMSGPLSKPVLVVAADGTEFTASNNKGLSADRVPSPSDSSALLAIAGTECCLAATPEIVNSTDAISVIASDARARDDGHPQACESKQPPDDDGCNSGVAHPTADGGSSSVIDPPPAGICIASAIVRLAGSVQTESSTGDADLLQPSTFSAASKQESADVTYTGLIGLTASELVTAKGKSASAVARVSSTAPLATDASKSTVAVLSSSGTPTSNDAGNLPQPLATLSFGTTGVTTSASLQKNYRIPRKPRAPSPLPAVQLGSVVPPGGVAAVQSTSSAAASTASTVASPAGLWQDGSAYKRRRLSPTSSSATSKRIRSAVVEPNVGGSGLSAAGGNGKQTQPTAKAGVPTIVASPASSAASPAARKVASSDDSLKTSALSQITKQPAATSGAAESPAQDGYQLGRSQMRPGKGRQTERSLASAAVPTASRPATGAPTALLASAVSSAALAASRGPRTPPGSPLASSSVQPLQQSLLTRKGPHTPPGSPPPGLRSNVKVGGPRTPPAAMPVRSTSSRGPRTPPGSPSVASGGAYRSSIGGSSGAASSQSTHRGPRTPPGSPRASSPLPPGHSTDNSSPAGKYCASALRRSTEQQIGRSPDATLRQHPHQTIRQTSVQSPAGAGQKQTLGQSSRVHSRTAESGGTPSALSDSTASMVTDVDDARSKTEKVFAALHQLAAKLQELNQPRADVSHTSSSTPAPTKGEQVVGSATTAASSSNWRGEAAAPATAERPLAEPTADSSTSNRPGAPIIPRATVDLSVPPPVPLTSRPLVIVDTSQPPPMSPAMGHVPPHGAHAAGGSSGIATFRPPSAAPTAGPSFAQPAERGWPPDQGTIPLQQLVMQPAQQTAGHPPSLPSLPPVPASAALSKGHLPLGSPNSLLSPFGHATETSHACFSDLPQTTLAASWRSTGVADVMTATSRAPAAGTGKPAKTPQEIARNLQRLAQGSSSGASDTVGGSTTCGPSSFMGAEDGAPMTGGLTALTGVGGNVGSSGVANSGSVWTHGPSRGPPSVVGTIQPPPPLFDGRVSADSAPTGRFGAQASWDNVHGRSGHGVASGHCQAGAAVGAPDVRCPPPDSFLDVGRSVTSADMHLVPGSCSSSAPSAAVDFRSAVPPSVDVHCPPPALPLGGGSLLPGLDVRCPPPPIGVDFRGPPPGAALDVAGQPVSVSMGSGQPVTLVDTRCPPPISADVLRAGQTSMSGGLPGMCGTVPGMNAALGQPNIISASPAALPSVACGPPCVMAGGLQGIAGPPPMPCPPGICGLPSMTTGLPGTMAGLSATDFRQSSAVAVDTRCPPPPLMSQAICQPPVQGGPADGRSVPQPLMGFDFDARYAANHGPDGHSSSVSGFSDVRGSSNACWTSALEPRVSLPCGADSRSSNSDGRALSPPGRAGNVMPRNGRDRRAVGRLGRDGGRKFGFGQLGKRHGSQLQKANRALGPVAPLRSDSKSPFKPKSRDKQPEIGSADQVDGGLTACRSQADSSAHEPANITSEASKLANADRASFAPEQDEGANSLSTTPTKVAAASASRLSNSGSRASTPQPAPDRTSGSAPSEKTAVAKMVEDDANATEGQLKQGAARQAVLAAANNSTVSASQPLPPASEKKRTMSGDGSLSLAGRGLSSDGRGTAVAGRSHQAKGTASGGRRSPTGLRPPKMPRLSSGSIPRLSLTSGSDAASKQPPSTVPSLLDNMPTSPVASRPGMTNFGSGGCHAAQQHSGSGRHGGPAFTYPSPTAVTGSSLGRDGKFTSWQAPSTASGDSPASRHGRNSFEGDGGRRGGEFQQPWMPSGPASGPHHCGSAPGFQQQQSFPSADMQGAAGRPTVAGLGDGGPPRGPFDVPPPPIGMHPQGPTAGSQSMQPHAMNQYQQGTHQGPPPHGFQPPPGNQGHHGMQAVGAPAAGSQAAPLNLFGSQNQPMQSFGHQGPTPSSFGQQGPPQHQFGQQGPSTSLFGQQGPPNPPFGQQGPSTPAFGQGPHVPFSPQGPPPAFGPQGPAQSFGPHGPPPSFGPQGPPPSFGLQGPPPSYGPQGPPATAPTGQPLNYQTNAGPGFNPHQGPPVPFNASQGPSAGSQQGLPTGANQGPTQPTGNDLHMTRGPPPALPMSGGIVPNAFRPPRPGDGFRVPPPSLFDGNEQHGRQTYQPNNQGPPAFGSTPSGPTPLFFERSPQMDSRPASHHSTRQDLHRSGR